ncbi:TPA: ABC transporter ATP-binding protein [Legionella pneumophila]|nr:ABC transporter ATP-binding protein [Legionella pneumophila]
MSESVKIQLQDVAVRYGRRPKPAVTDISLEVRENSFVTVIGPSGCGKSTLLKVVSKVMAPSEGSVIIDGKSAAEVDLTGRLSFMFQQPLLLPWRTARDNVLLPLQVIRPREKRKNIEEATKALELVGLGHALELRPHEMSGGMRQRAALARALVSKPEILLMDEPFGAVDEINRAKLQLELLSIWERLRPTIILVTHQIEEAVLLSDQIVVMSDSPGTIAEIVPVHLERPRGAEIRSSDEFHELVDYLRARLQPLERTPES